MLSSLVIANSKNKVAAQLLPKVICGTGPLTISITSTTSTTGTSSATPTTTTTIRSKHSKRQVKRLFQKNPAFHRVSNRNSTQPKKFQTPPPLSTIDPIFEPPVILPNGWSEPPGPADDDVLQKRNAIPFSIKRTGGKPNGAVGFLPVYSNVRVGGSKRTTIIKKIYGNKDIFLEELRAVLSISADDDDAIRLRASGNTVEVNGNRTKEVKRWLAGLGF
mmetsp:Transcript_172/g.245  ORF Transcript_172/g.245 Transcript_172/m.245 type:complete len:219 (+) Transcript_172:98-754(+)|eukprot:CAMPEP_0203636014 /NCGR_PEP_ID=MMETSP0088-20131115/2650_1 /ASSEMBLY_ACC=CAM_ASM_001087 /TAXON_ID=426623 /ORGANISM="Chaetoceros affinis, Strain CCMP159" /LENGTH=218 /DNA_ID=CAMNT_0050490039 /DNA_START=144 /DNA_END=800 /DNA_ORIENTATION=+